MNRLTDRILLAIMIALRNVFISSQASLASLAFSTIVVGSDVSEATG